MLRSTSELQGIDLAKGVQRPEPITPSHLPVVTEPTLWSPAVPIAGETFPQGGRLVLLNRLVFTHRQRYEILIGDNRQSQSLSALGRLEIDVP